MLNNQSLKFVLPLVTTNIPSFYLREDFVGCFIGDVERPEFDGKLLLVYNYPWTREFAKFDSKISEQRNYITSYDYVDKGVTVFVLELINADNDLELILEGKYSEISPENKLRISKFWYSYSGSSLAEQVMNKENYMMKQYWTRSQRNREDYCAPGECWFIPDLEKEIFDKNNI